MTLKDCYAAFGGDYVGVVGRMLTEERVKKFLQMFGRDTSYADLCKAMQSGAYDKAFLAAHTLKGVCANLGIDRLHKLAEEITETLRGNVNNGADAILPALQAEYQLTVDAIALLD